MHTRLWSALAGLAVVLAPSEAHAQFPGIASYNAWVAPTPYYVPGPIGYSTYYSSPYGYRSAYTTGVYPTPWGSNAYSYYNQQARPIYSGAYHSIYWDPITLTYRYGTGIRNTPTYSYRYFYGY